MLKLDTVWQPDSQQKQFRLLLEAMSRPGECYAMATVPEDGPVTLSLLATLLDAEVSLADPNDLLRNEDWPMLQAKPELPEQADYILCDGAQPPDFIPKIGTLACPEQSATLILVVDELGQTISSQSALTLKLTGPGIATSKILSICGLDSDWLSVREGWNDSFPLGVDWILVDSARITALPRTTKVELL